jgi:cytochrome b subunit of formate dehydrogenase
MAQEEVKTAPVKIFFEGMYLLPSDIERIKEVREMMQYIAHALVDTTNFNTIADIERFSEMVKAKIKYLKTK